jgi:hypothetical protein
LLQYFFIWFCFCFCFFMIFPNIIFSRGKYCSFPHMLLWIATVLSYIFFLFFLQYFLIFFTFFSYSTFPFLLLFVCFFVFFSKIIFVNFTFLILSWLKIQLFSFFPLKYYRFLRCFPTWFFCFIFYEVFQNCICWFYFFNIQLIENLVL